jgi:hypothetical protein
MIGYAKKVVTPLPARTLLRCGKYKACTTFTAGHAFCVEGDPMSPAKEELFAP